MFWIPFFDWTENLQELNLNKNKKFKIKKKKKKNSR